MDLEDIFDNPAFWILGLGGVTAEVIGWRVSKSFGASLPMWQFLILIIGTLVAAAFFANRE